jgi:hypothetical protein
MGIATSKGVGQFAAIIRARFSERLSPFVIMAQSYQRSNMRSELMVK